jgi:site-specific recombinase XerD
MTHILSALGGVLAGLAPSAALLRRNRRLTKALTEQTVVNDARRAMLDAAFNTNPYWPRHSHGSDLLQPGEEA